MRRALSATITTLVLLLIPTLAVSSASADPPKQTFIVQCGTTIYVAVSPNVRIFLDTQSNTLLILAPVGVPQRLLTSCTATAVFGPESVSGNFLITPAG